VVSPAVQGNVTLKINRPLTKDEIIPALNTVFQLSGATIVESGGVVKVVPTAEAGHQGADVTLESQPQTPGFGYEIVSLRYVSSEEMQRMLAPVAPAGSILSVGTLPNVLILAGTEQDRANMIGIVKTFDVNWLSGMSFGIFPLTNTDPPTVIGEVWEVLGTQTGPLAKIVKMMPLGRLNAILAMSSQPRYLKQIKEWVERLDADEAPTGTEIWVYPVQNGRASDLAKTLNKLLTGDSGKFDTAKNDALAAPLSRGQFD